MISSGAGFFVVWVCASIRIILYGFLFKPRNPNFFQHVVKNAVISRMLLIWTHQLTITSHCNNLAITHLFSLLLTSHCDSVILHFWHGILVSFRFGRPDFFLLGICMFAQDTSESTRQILFAKNIICKSTLMRALPPHKNVFIQPWKALILFSFCSFTLSSEFNCFFFAFLFINTFYIYNRMALTMNL